jgi:hypothetical protein
VCPTGSALILTRLFWSRGGSENAWGAVRG